MNNNRVFIIDPGYSIKEKYEKWLDNDYPGHILYGVNHFKEAGFEAIFQNANTKVGEISLGNSKFQILFNRLRAEINTAIEVIKRKNEYDYIYLPLVNFGNLTMLLRKFKIIKKPVIGLIHSTYYYNKIKIFQYKTIYSSLDRIVFLSSEIKNEFEKRYPMFAGKGYFLELMPELPVRDNHINNNSEKIYDFCLIGKTHRDYETLSKAAKLSKSHGIIVGGVDSIKYKNEFVEVINTPLSFKECASIYEKSKINVVSVYEMSGIYGLTSIMDTYTFALPVISTRTEFSFGQVKKRNIGIEIREKDEDGLAKALTKLKEDSKFYDECKANLLKIRQKMNSVVFAKELCSLMKELSEE